MAVKPQVGWSSSFCFTCELEGIINVPQPSGMG
jgi:hypothetical protein